MKKLDYSVIDWTNAAIKRAEQRKKAKKEKLLYNLLSGYVVFVVLFFIADLLINLF